MTYSQDLVEGYCDGTDPTIVANKVCTIPVTTLMNPPFEIPWGSSIWARVQAVNVIGSSSFSSAGNGAILLSVPGAPTDLENIPETTNGFQIGISWIAPT